MILLLTACLNFANAWCRYSKKIGGKSYELLGCDTGSYCPATSTEWFTSRIECKKCPSRLICPGGASEYFSSTSYVNELPNPAIAVLCPAGKYSNGGVCDNCPAGKFSNNINDRSGCINCPEGKYSTVPGSKYCFACPKGRYSPQKSKTCDMCVPGKVALSSSAVGCTSCTPGKYAPNEGGGGCLPCKKGSWSSSDSEQCSSCPPGYDTEDKAEQDICKKCKPGRYALKEGTGLCDVCIAGRYSNEIGRKTDCDPCPKAGTVSYLAK